MCNARPRRRLVALLVLIGSLPMGCVRQVADTAPAHDAVSETASATPPVAPRLETGIRTNSKPRLVATIAYDCEDSALVVTKLDGEGGLWLFLPEETRHLPRVPTASGSRYSDGVFSVWSKGSEAMILTADSEHRCVENRQRSIIEDARLRGNDYWAAGTQPAWTLEIGPEFTVLSVDHGQMIYTMLTRSPQTSTALRRTTWTAGTQGVSVRIVFEAGPCIDTGSGMLFESFVTVTIDEDRTLSGCGQALH